MKEGELMRLASAVNAEKGKDKFLFRLREFYSPFLGRSTPITKLGAIQLMDNVGVKNYNRNKAHFNGMPLGNINNDPAIDVNYYIPMNAFADIITALHEGKTAKGTSPAVASLVSEARFDDYNLSIAFGSYTREWDQGVALGKIAYSFDPGPFNESDCLIDYSGSPALSMRIQSDEERFKFNDWFNNSLSSLLDKHKTSTLIDDFFERLISGQELKPEEKERLYDSLLELNLLTRDSIKMFKPASGGFTSRSSFTLDNIFIKMDETKRINTEYSNYLKDYGEFNQFMPQPITSVTADDYGIMALTNIQKELPGFLIANKQFNTNFKGHDLNYHLFLMGLFHKETQKHINDFNQLIYKGIHGLSHDEESVVPHASQSGNAYKLFKETAIDPKKVTSIIENYREQQALFGNDIIHGDWKIPNVPNGYLVDYTQMGRGFAIDELAYFLSDEQFRTTKEQFHQHTDNYAAIRSSHDQTFRSSSRTQMHQLADSALLTQLVLRHAVMNKRDLNDPEKLHQREYYQQTINNLLKTGSFI